MAALIVLIENGLTLMYMPRLLTNAEFREQCLRRVTEPQVVEFFHDRYDRWGREAPLMRESTLNKIGAFSLNPGLKLMLSQRANHTGRGARFAASPAHAPAAPAPSGAASGGGSTVTCVGSTMGKKYVNVDKLPYELARAGRRGGVESSNCEKRPSVTALPAHREMGSNQVYRYKFRPAIGAAA
jgi:hypothetical protein